MHLLSLILGFFSVIIHLFNRNNQQLRSGGLHSEHMENVFRAAFHLSVN